MTANDIGTEQEAEEFTELVETAMTSTQADWEQALEADAASKVDTVGLQKQFAEALADVVFDEEPLVTSVAVQTFRPVRSVLVPLQASVAISLRLGGDEDLRHRFWKGLNATGKLGPGQGAPLDLNDDVLTAPGTMPASEVRDVLVEATDTVERALDALRQSQAQDEQLRRAVEAAARKRADADTGG